MQDSVYIYEAIAVMAVANFLTRVFPFIFFIKHEPPKFVIFVEKSFPPIIMTILIFYTLSGIDFTNAPYGLREIIAIVFTALLHLKFDNYLVSIFSGTIFYMALVQYF
ncbi:MAG: branched-chain amino acid ABC transporter [Epsilonproteobacteria bacterium]|nr:branched-chain amino acid ABC transporter [Campylobacterota bacterium]